MHPSRSNKEIHWSLHACNFFSCASSAGLSRHDIAKRTGHKRVESLDPYIQDRCDVAYSKATKFQRSLTTKYPMASTGMHPANGAATVSTVAPNVGHRSVPVSAPQLPLAQSALSGNAGLADVLSLYTSGIVSILQNFKQ